MSQFEPPTPLDNTNLPQSSPDGSVAYTQSDTTTAAKATYGADLTPDELANLSWKSKRDRPSIDPIAASLPLESPSSIMRFLTGTAGRVIWRLTQLVSPIVLYPLAALIVALILLAAGVRLFAPNWIVVEYLEPGDCLAIPGPGPSLTGIAPQPCSDAHGAEVIALVSGPESQALEDCASEFARWAGRAINDLPENTEPSILIYAPEGNRTPARYYCIIGSPSGELTRSVLD